MQRFESRRPRLESGRISIPECGGSNPAAPASESVSNAYGIGSRYQRTSHGVESNIQVYDEIPEPTSQRSPSAGDAVVHSAICCLAVSAVDREENRFPRE